jgi:RNA polymerase sigma factor (TIGR02999 family)
MRQILVDYARARAAKKRGGRSPNLQTVVQAAAADIASDTGVDRLGLLELDDALEALKGEDESLAQLIEMRYFGGMTAEESAEALGRSVHSVRHDLRFAQAWLRRALGS